jgi:DNA-binding CsgD family transcriptional regulator
MAEYGEPLSNRETEVLELVATGATNRQIAQELVVSVNTVKVHVRNIFTKLGVESRTEATLIAIRDGLIIVPEIETVSESGETEPSTTEEDGATSLAEIQLPLPWPKRAALVLGILLAALGSALTWPRMPNAAVMADPSTDSSLVGTGPGNVALTDSKWHKLAPMTTARSRFALVATANGQLYAIAGETNGGVTASVERFDPAENQWTLLTGNKPTRVSNIAGAIIQDRIYVPGGRAPDGAATAVVEVLNLADETWSQVRSLPRPLYGYGLAVYADELYVFGGTDGRLGTNSVYIYNPQQDAWREGVEMPASRSFAAAATLGPRIFVIGGYDGNREQAICEVYQPEQRKWESCAPLVLGRGGLGLAAVADRLFVVGGGWSDFLAFSEKFNPATATWTPFETPVRQQWLNPAVASGPDRFYVAGGWNGDYLNGLWEYEYLWIKIHVPYAP